MAVPLRNPLDGDLVTSLTEQLRACHADDSVRVIVLTNTGNTFCAGGHLKKVGGAPTYRPTVELFELMQQGPKVVVGCINGHCMGGGVGLAAACDLSLIRSDAQVGFTEVRIGVAPAMISAPGLGQEVIKAKVLCLPKLGRTEAARLMLLGLKA